MKLLDQYNKPLFQIKDIKNKLLFECNNKLLNLNDLNLSHAKLKFIRAEGLICMNTNFSYADFEGADLYLMLANDADFSYCFLLNADMRGSNLTGVDFSHADLSRANLGEDNMNGATRLQGATFYNALLKEAYLNNAEYDNATVFPKGFSPTKEGMVFVAEQL